MTPFDRRPRLRWAIPVSALAVLAAGAALGPLGAAADSGLPQRSAEELLVAVQEAKPTPLSGTVSMDVDLGLPELPMGMAATTGPLALASGENTLRVWSDGDRQRLALIERSAETNVIRNGQEVWVWSSSQGTADRYTLAEPPAGDAATLPPGVSVPKTPQDAAEMALSAIEPTTAVTTSGVASVAGRDVYELILTPRQGDTLVRRVVISLDAATMVPLRTRVFPTVGSGAAVDVGFTSVEFASPDPGLFSFTPPPGATVTDHAAPADDQGDASADRDRSVAEPIVVGEGWSSVLIGALPPTGLADLAEQGSRADSDDPAANALALLEALPQRSGSWGSGRVLAGTLLSAIVTDDGRVAIGAVPPDAVAEALARK